MKGDDIMDDYNNCPAKVEIENLKDDISEAKEDKNMILQKLEDLQKQILSSVTKLLISVIIVVGGAAISMIVFYLTTVIHKGP